MVTLTIFEYTGSQKKGGLANAAVFALLLIDIEPRIFISNILENWNPYVCAKYRTISEQYQEAEKWIFQISISILFYLQVPCCLPS